MRGKNWERGEWDLPGARSVFARMGDPGDFRNSLAVGGGDREGLDPRRAGPRT